MTVVQQYDIKNMDNPIKEMQQAEEPRNTSSQKLSNCLNKYICKRTRKDRYEVTSSQINRFDERRLIDTRFWIFVGAISNMLF